MSTGNRCQGTHLPYAPFACSDPETALMLLKKRPVDLIILDNKIVGGGLPVLARAQRELRRTTPTILTDTSMPAHTGYLLGVRAFFLKPIDLPTFLETAAEIIQTTARCPAAALRAAVGGTSWRRGT